MTTLTAHVTDDFVSRHRLEIQRWRETQEAIEAAERGEVVSGEEVFAWLDTWGQEGLAAK